MSVESDGPTLEVWEVAGADATPAELGPPADPPVVAADHWALAGVMTEAGAHPVDDRGLLVGEIAGLEVCRVVNGDDGPTIDVGVGQADRELHELVHGQAELDDELRRVIAAVAHYRKPGSHHPLTRVGRERWLRSALLDNPQLVGAEQLEPLVPLRSRRGLKRAEPAAAAGTTPNGNPIVVVAMVGVDPDIVPEAADYRDRFNPDAELVIAVPERDVALNSTLLDRIADATVVAVDPPW